MLSNMEHRGGQGSEPNSGDGAGILIQIPHRFFAQEAERLGFALPEQGFYGVGILTSDWSKQHQPLSKEEIKTYFRLFLMEGIAAVT